MGSASKRILVYTDEPGVGGIAQYNHAILLGLRDRGYDVILVQSKADNPLIQEQQARGVQHEWLSFNPFQEFGRTLTDGEETAEIFARLQPDLIWFSDGCPLSNLAAKQVAMDLNLPFAVVVGFAEPELAKTYANYLDRLAASYDQAKLAIAVSQENLDLLHRHFCLPATKGEVIRYGRPDAYFAPTNLATRTRLRQELGISDEGVVCFTAARLDGIKGYQFQLDAIVRLQHHPLWPQLYFVWAGEGPLRRDLESAIDSLEVANQVKLIGQQWNIPEWLDAADIFILPTYREGMPLAVMEAMAKGLPILASAISGIPEELGETGRLLPNPNHQPAKTLSELVSAIASWGSDANLRRIIGQAERRRAMKLFRVDRMVEETLQAMERALLPTGDYISPGLTVVRPDAAFPNMEVGDPAKCPWPHLRQGIAHNWYVDRRRPVVGFLDRDEAHILYNTALQFKGKRALEIGCWLGWSACHLALAGVRLDVVDPLLERAEFYESVSQSLKDAGVWERVNLVPGPSPQKVQALVAEQQRRWSLMFIDGDHETPGPLQDAIACEPFAEADAAILFHDLASPDVTEGLDYLRQRGWNVLIYQTMQIMGIAWRGNVQPITHQPDPTIVWSLPAHLQTYPVSGGQRHRYSIASCAEEGAARSGTDTLLNQALHHLDRLNLTQKQPTFASSLVNDLAQRQQLAHWQAQGREFYKRGNQAGAMASFSLMLDINPASAIAHHHLSTLHWQRGDLQASLNHHAWAQRGHLLAETPHSEEFQTLMAAVRPYTLLSQERLFSLYTLTKQICLDDIPGTFVECGTYRGGAAAMMAATMQRYSLRPRLLYAFDTFEGMPDPTDADRHDGVAANDTGFGAGTLQAPVSEYFDKVCQALEVQDCVVAVPGLFADTLPENKGQIGAIALLHADGDWYESTWDIFSNLYDQVQPEGFIQIDDYGHWEGCRQAIHEFERSRNLSSLLQRIDYTGVWCRKTDPAHPNCNYWRSLWTLAKTAQLQGQHSLAIQIVQAIQKLTPDSIQANHLLNALPSDTENVPEAFPSFAERLGLRKINLIAFPAWDAEEETLLETLVELLRAIATHPDRQQLCLLLDISGMDAETANLAVSGAVMYLLAEDGLELDTEDGPQIAPVDLLADHQRPQLLAEIAARIALPAEHQAAIATSGSASLPACDLATLKTMHAIRRLNGTWIFQAVPASATTSVIHS